MELEKKKVPVPKEWLVALKQPMLTCRQTKPQKTLVNTMNWYSLLGCDNLYDEEEPMQISRLTLNLSYFLTISRTSCCILESKPKDGDQRKHGGEDKAIKPLSK
jgi:hypothetical protein